MFARLEKNAAKLSLQELIFAKESERDYISQNIPLVLSARVLGDFSSENYYLQIFWVTLKLLPILLILYNYNIITKNIQIYNTEIIKRMWKESREKNENDKKILCFLMSIEKHFDKIN